MSYYDTFLSLNKPPSENWREALQVLVNQTFENSSTFYDDIEEEDSFGSMSFHTISARITSLVDAKTGQRVNDDYKKIIFQDLSYKPSFGSRFRFNDNIWIVFSTDNIRTDTSSVYIRRCNNTMNTQDEYGNIHIEPCYIDYKVTENQIFRNNEVDVPSGRIWVQCQLNEHTKNIKINTRFIFSGTCYKVRNVNVFDRRNTMESDTSRTVAFYADYDNISESDNLELGIADYKNFNYTISSCEEIIGVIGDSGIVNSEILLNCEKVNLTRYFRSTNPTICSVDKKTGEYSFKNNGTCSIVITVNEVYGIRKEIQVTVTNSIIDKYTTILEPCTEYIALNDFIKYSIFEYNNGRKTDTTFTFTFSGAEDKCYKKDFDDNNFIIMNTKPSQDVDLIISCKNNRTGNIDKTLYIELGGL